MNLQEFINQIDIISIIPLFFPMIIIPISFFICRKFILFFSQSLFTIDEEKYNYLEEKIVPEISESEYNPIQNYSWFGISRKEI